MFPARSIPRCLRPLPRLLSGIGAMVVATALHAQGIDYQVRIDAPGQLDDLLEENLDLMRWRGNARVDMEQLQRLVKEAPEQAKTLIATEGYYSPKVSAGLDTSGGRPVARLIVDPGQPVLVGDIDLVLQGFVSFEKGGTPFDAGALRSRWQLPVGARFRQADWEAAKRELLREVTKTRFPRARLVETSATVDPDALRALLHVVIDSGPEMRFGALRIRGLTRYPREVITNLNKINPGDLYSEAALQAFQSRLQDTGYFSSVEVSADLRAVLNAELQELKEGDDDPDAKPATPEPPTGPTVLPVLVRVTENKQKNVEVGLGFSTDTGVRAQVSYDDLNVFGKRMKNDLLYEQKRQTARTDFYWPTTAKGYNDSVGAGIERNDVRGEITTLATVAARRAWGTPLLERSLTVEALVERREVPPKPSTNTRSLPLTYSITKRRLDSLIQPTNGYVLQGQLGGALLPILTDEKFLRLYLRGLYMKPLGDSGTLVLRGEFGAVAAKDKIGVPGTFLFRAGGDQSVRGYGYRELGVRENGAIVGGKYMATASAEYQYWFRPPWGVAVFYDAGNAGDKVGDLHPKSGFGVGARWRSPVGPINVDVAYGHAVKKARLHFSLGFTF
ncbi:MAG: autotransporter assembly complex protein TamA [Telluria sp.]